MQSPIMLSGADEFRLTKHLRSNNVPPCATLSHTCGSDDEESGFNGLANDFGKKKIATR